MGIGVYIKWCKTWKTFPVISWIRAAKYYRAGEFERAQCAYLKGLDRHPNHPARFSARLDLAYCLFKSRRFAEAEEHLRFVVSHAPHMREAYVRLSRLYLWIGRSSDAIWTIRRGIQKAKIVDSELSALLLLAVIENGGPSYVLKEALNLTRELAGQSSTHELMKVAQARFMIQRGDREKGKEILRQLATQQNALFEAVLHFAETLLEDDEIEESVQQLRRVLQAAADHPRVLSLLAAAYLRESTLFNPEYSRQLAVSSCQHSNWGSPRELHVLAESYLKTGDKMSALVVASKAKDLGSRLLASYADAKKLDRLIERLSSGTQA